MTEHIPTIREYIAAYESTGRLDLESLRPFAEDFFRDPEFEHDLADRRARTFVDLAAQARRVADRVRKASALVEYPDEKTDVAAHLADEYVHIARIRAESGEIVPNVRIATRILDAVQAYVLHLRRADFVEAVTHDPVFSGACVRAIDDFFGGAQKVASLGVSSTHYAQIRDEAMWHVARQDRPTARDFDEPVRIAAKKILGIETPPAGDAWPGKEA